MFEQVAVELFYQRAVRDHVALRALGIAVICYALFSAHLVTAPFFFAWAGLIGLAELGVRAWRRADLRRPQDPATFRRSVRGLIGWGALLTWLYAAPALFIYRQGDIGAAIAVIVSAAVLLVICAQHNLTRGMFYTSAVVPAIGLTLSMWRLGGAAYTVPMLTMAFALIANARNLHHAGVATFKGLVESKLEADRTNARLQTALEAAEAGSRAKSTFLATMSHEIRTPLNGVLGMAEALAAAPLDARTAEAVGVIRSSGKALLAILNDVLDLSKIEAGRLQLEPAEFDLAEAARDVALLFEPSAAEKGVALSIDIDPTSGICRGDPARVRQILSNLVSNAVKFTGRGEVGIVVERLSDQVVRLVVRDTGIGVAPDQLLGLFDRFTQADGSITRRFGGTGLGLSICRELAELMGGDIAAESRPGQGSAFTVTLPLPLVRAAEPPAAESEARAEVPSLRLLCAEDNPVNQLVLRTLLGQLGCEPVIAADGREAVELWRSGDWDMVLMDMQMPVMDGISAVREIRAEEARTGRPRTPIVAVTADAFSEQVVEQKAAGVDLHLAKPIEARALVAVLSAALELCPGERQVA